MAPLKVDNVCPYCDCAMNMTRMSCASCKVSIEAEFPDRPLSRLPVEHQRFIEIFVLAGGSLKEIAKQAGVSYPTVRNRLDKVIEQLSVELDGDAKQIGKSEAGKKKADKSAAGKSNAAEILKNI